MACKSIFALVALAATTLAQNTTRTEDAQTTLNIPFGDYGADGFVASVQTADACDTTLVIGCAQTAAPNDLCELVTDLAATVVVGPTGYEFRYTLNTLGGSGVASQTCDLEGPMTAVTGGTCTAYLSLDVAGVSTATSTVIPVSPEDVNYARVPVTAGASNLPTGSASCSPTSGGGAPVPTHMVMSVVKVLVPVAAVAGALL